MLDGDRRVLRELSVEAWGAGMSELVELLVELSDGEPKPSGDPTTGVV